MHDYIPLIGIWRNDGPGVLSLLTTIERAIKHNVAVRIAPHLGEIGLYLAAPPPSQAIFAAIAEVVRGTE